MTHNSWKEASIGELCKFTNGRGFTPSDWSDKGLPIIRIQNLNGSSNFHYYEGETDEKWVIMAGDILFAWAGTRGVSFGATIWNGPKGVLNQHIYRVHPVTGIDRTWLYYALEVVTSRIEKKAHGFKSTLLHVQKADITNQTVVVAPLAEQIKIAALLSTWEAGIKQTEKLITAKIKCKRGLMQQLLTGKKRLQKFADQAWEELKLSDVFERVTRKNNEGNTNVVTVSAQRGFVKQNEFFNRIVASQNLDDYFLVKEGEFCYNKSYTNDYAWGATKRLKGFEKAVVTTLYICFRVKDESRHSGDFLEQLFEACLLDKGLTKIAHEGGRAHGLLNVTPSDFFNLIITIPSYDEQAAIAQVLQTADREIDLLKRQLDALKRQKRALMQKLLTGQIRVKVNNFEAATVEAS